jgi:hypothetical protein
MIWQFIQQHYVMVGLGVLYVLVAFRNTMPPPGTIFSWYEWFFNATGVLMNSPKVQAFEQKVGIIQTSADGTSKETTASRTTTSSGVL